MQTDSGNTVSVWMDTAVMPSSGPPLAGDVRADICVVGAGIAGLTTAYLLARSGRSVVVLDDGPIAGGETSRTTAHLSNAIDDRYWWIEIVHGKKGARLAAESHTAAIERIGAIVQEEGIDCAFERLPGYLFIAEGGTPQDLSRELEAARRAGLSDVELLSRVPISGVPGPCLLFPRQGQFHPLRYMAGLARAIVREGGRIATGAHAKEIAGGSPARVAIAAGPTVTADAVVVATNSPVNTRLAIHTKQAPYRTYAIAARMAAGSIPRALFWDTGDPYHYVRLSGEEDPLVIVGGEDHKTGQEEHPEERHRRLESWMRGRFPAAGKVQYRWSGQVMETVDGLAFIGKSPDGEENVLVATGDSGMGMTHGTIAGILLHDLLSGNQNPWGELYDPGRISLRAAGEFARENANVAAQYGEYATALVTAESAEGIAPGDGAVVRRGVHFVAAYRDESGSLHECSAVCPHLGCLVAWNRLEKSWDCPCHGSRFDPEGRVVNGPAISGLGPERASGDPKRRPPKRGRPARSV